MTAEFQRLLVFLADRGLEEPSFDLVAENGPRRMRDLLTTEEFQVGWRAHSFIHLTDTVWLTAVTLPRCDNPALLGSIAKPQVAS